MPAGGLIANVASPTYGNESAQLLVQNFNNGQFKVAGIEIDGAGGTCPASAAGGATRTVGIKLLNVGDPAWTSAAGIVQNTVVRNQIDGCGLGEGIDSENSYITIDRSVVRDVDRNGIIAAGGDTLFTNNTMHNVAQWGIWMAGGSKSVISNNVLSTQGGILLDDGTTGVTVSGNVIGPFTGTGILLVQVEGNTVRNNQVNGSYAGIWPYRAAKTMVTGNILNPSNSLSDTPAGIVLYQSDGSGDAISANEFSGVDRITATSLW